MGHGGKLNAASLRAAAGIKVITATAVLINGEREAVDLKVLRGDDALRARKRVFREASDLKKLMPDLTADGGGVDVNAITEDQLLEAGRVQEDCYADILSMVVDVDEEMTREEWLGFASATGGRDSDFGVEVYRAAGLTHPRVGEAKREARGSLDNLPFSSRARRG